MSRRGQALLRAQRRPRFRGVDLPPLTEGPPAWLDAEQRAMWDTIRAASPGRLAALDTVMLAAAAALVVSWRRGDGSMEELRLCYRMLGQFFVPMPERRRLLFPERSLRQ